MHLSQRCSVLHSVIRGGFSVQTESQPLITAWYSVLLQNGALVFCNTVKYSWEEWPNAECDRVLLWPFNVSIPCAQNALQLPECHRHHLDHRCWQHRGHKRRKTKRGIYGRQRRIEEGAEDETRRDLRAEAEPMENSSCVRIQDSGRKVDGEQTRAVSL